MDKDIDDMIEDMRETPMWNKMIERDAKAKKKANERGDQRRKGIY